jgi:hypothetical protein
MLSPAFARGFSGPDRSTMPMRVLAPRQVQRDWATVLPLWHDAFAHFDKRVQAILARIPDGDASGAGPASEWCVACLSDVRHAVYELHVWLLYERIRPTTDCPAIVSYLARAYVWCGDVLDDVEAWLTDLRSGSCRRDAALAEDSVAYIEDYLCPLLGQVFDSSLDGGAARRASRALRPLVERLHIAIVSLNWALMAN